MAITLKRIEAGIYFSLWEGDVSYDDMIAARIEAAETPKEHGDDDFVLIYEFNDVRVPDFSFGNFNISAMRNLMSKTSHIVYEHVIFTNLSGGARMAISTYHRLFKGLGRNDYYVQNLEEAIEKARGILNKNA